MNRRTAARRATRVTLALLLVSACGGDDQKPADVGAPRPVTSSASPAPTVPTQPTERRVAVYYIADVDPAGPRLYREFRDVPGSTSEVAAAVDAMLHVAPLDKDYSSLWPRNTKLRSVALFGDTATIDFSREVTKGNAGASFESASVQQLVHTVTAADKAMKKVRIHVEGKPVETLWGHVDTRKPIARGAQVDTLAPVWIIDPQQGAKVGRALTVKGDATVFEATVSWSVLVGDDVVKDGFVTASEGGPGRGTWTFSVTLPDTVSGQVTIRAWEDSAEDGRDLSVDTKVVTVS